MPPVDPFLHLGAIIAVSLAAAAAIAVYESPELRQWAEQCRQRMLVALQELQPPPRPQRPRFNRPEDAEGFMRSTADIDTVDADDESRRRQREELMYWNQIRLEKLERERAKSNAPSTDFDHFLHRDPDRDGTYVYNSGADTHVAGNVLRRRGDADLSSRGLQRGAGFANPFSDEHGIELEDRQQDEVDQQLMASGMYDDIYSVSEAALRRPGSPTSASTETMATPDASVIDVADAAAVPEPLPTYEESSVFADIRAWADSTASLHRPPTSSPALSNFHSAAASLANLHPASFYSPPATSTHLAPPDAADDDDSDAGSAIATPTDSLSVVDADVVSRADISSAGDAPLLDVLSDDGIAVSTPGTWTEVGSVVSESEHERELRAH